MYLLHVTVLNLLVLSQTQKWRYSHFSFLVTFSAVLFLSFIAGLFVAVFVESPASRMTKHIERYLSDWLGQKDKSPQKPKKPSPRKPPRPTKINN